MSKVCRDRELKKFKCWMEKKFTEGSLDNVSRLQWIVDMYLRDMDLEYSKNNNNQGRGKTKRYSINYTKINEATKQDGN